MEEPPVSELMNQMSAALRSRHYSRRTQQAYRLWVRRIIRFHGIRHPVDMAAPEINAFVTHLAVDERVSASTQTQALSALLFLCRRVIGREVGELAGLVRDGKGGKDRVAPPEALARKYPDAPSDRRRRRVVPRRRRHRQAREPPQPAPFLRDPPPRGGLQRPPHPGAARSQARQHAHNLHPRAEPRRPRRAQPHR